MAEAEMRVGHLKNWEINWEALIPRMIPITPPTMLRTKASIRN